MPGIVCEHCTAVCCRYIALPLDTPETRGDFDDIRWYLLHENVSVFVEDGDWYIAFQASCRHLLLDHRCGIYRARPRICRQYSAADCDYHSGDYNWQEHFTRPEHLDAYVRARRGDHESTKRRKREKVRAGREKSAKRRERGRTGKDATRPQAGARAQSEPAVPAGRICPK
jgi:Fe-S-cluster containining protein